MHKLRKVEEEDVNNGKIVRYAAKKDEFKCKQKQKQKKRAHTCGDEN